MTKKASLAHETQNVSSGAYTQLKTRNTPRIGYDLVE